jgi:sugar lactone lactonase YvrE
VDRTLKLPVQKPTMCAFGGDNLEIMYITSIGAGGGTPLQPGQPQAGSIFACEPGVRGLPEPKFRG